MMLSSGLVEEQRVFDGRTTKTLLRPTRKARELFDLDTTEPSTASLAHSYWIRHWERRLQEAGYTVIREHPRAGGNADLFAGKPQNGRESPNELVVEVETGKSDVVANVLNDLRSGFNPVVVVATDDDALRIVERQLAEAGLLIPGRVQLALRERLPKTWRCSALDHQHNAH
jgi:hypothetical protein